MKEDDARHLRVMLDDLSQYRAGRLALSNLIDGLEVRARQLAPPPDEESELWQQWYVLEDVYAEALDRDATNCSLSSQERELVSRAISELERWLCERTAEA